MSNFDFLKTYQRLQCGIYIDKIIDLEFATLSFAETDKSSYSNSALINNIPSTEELKTIEEKLLSLKRNPAIYYENRETLNKITTFLVENKYEKHSEDSWMFHDGKNIDTSRFGQIHKVTSIKELQIWLDTLDLCFQKNDPQNPYGDVKIYLKPGEKAWLRFKDTNRFECFIAYKNGVPVAVGSLSNFEGIGYILNIGSLKKVRGEGFGKLITQYCAYTSAQNGNIYHCLATELGTYPYEFYQRIGFSKKFSAICYNKKLLGSISR